MAEAKLSPGRWISSSLTNAAGAGAQSSAAGPGEPWVPRSPLGGVRWRWVRAPRVAGPHGAAFSRQWRKSPARPRGPSERNNKIMAPNAHPGHGSHASRSLPVPPEGNLPRRGSLGGEGPGRPAVGRDGGRRSP